MVGKMAAGLDPYFYSVEDYGKDIASVRGTFGFPYASPIGEGFRVGIYNFARRIEIRNGGDMETYVEVEIKATGQVTNPQVMINGACMKLLDVLQRYRECTYLADGFLQGSCSQ